MKVGPPDESLVSSSSLIRGEFKVLSAECQRLWRLYSRCVNFQILETRIVTKDMDSSEDMPLTYSAAIILSKFSLEMASYSVTTKESKGRTVSSLRFSLPSTLLTK